jgi:hypothetical protein
VRVPPICRRGVIVALKARLIAKSHDLGPLEAVDAPGSILDCVESTLPGPIDHRGTIDAENFRGLTSCDVAMLRAVTVRMLAIVTAIGWRR